MIVSIRRDPLREIDIIISPGRLKRPHDTTKEAARKICPFCPGNEKETPPEIMRIEEGEGWRIRVIPNKYPIVSPPLGHHEVIVDTPDHALKPWDMEKEQLSLILQVIKSRIEEIKRSGKVKFISIFKNHGREAGASLSHPHTQLVTLSFLPQAVKREIDRLKLLYHRYGRCFICALSEEEKNAITETENFTACTPKASLAPFEVWILPKKHVKAFEETSELEELATLMLKILKGMNNCLGDHPFNLLIKTTGSTVDDPLLHWHMEIIPRTTTFAGLELSAFTFVNPVPPEEAAKRLRQALEDT